MTYDELVSYLENLLQVDSENETEFLAILPATLNDAQGRIYREIDFLDTRVQPVSTAFTANNRQFIIPDDILVIQSIAAITPSTSITIATGTQNTLEPVSLDFIDYTWPTALATSTNPVPLYFTMLDATTAIVAPTPFANYTAVVTGVVRPETLSDANTSNYLSETYPDLLVAACMVFLSGYQRDFGSMTNGPPGMSVSWESHYITLKQSVMDEEQRRKHQSTSWSPYSMAPLSTPQRP